jgi:hypothetical protein
MKGMAAEELENGEPFLTLGNISKHCFLGPKKYFFHTTLSHQANSIVINLYNSFVLISMFIIPGS